MNKPKTDPGSKSLTESPSKHQLAILDDSKSYSIEALTEMFSCDVRTVRRWLSQLEIRVPPGIKAFAFVSGRQIRRALESHSAIRSWNPISASKAGAIASGLLPAFNDREVYSFQNLQESFSCTEHAIVDWLTKMEIPYQIGPKGRHLVCGRHIREALERAVEKERQSQDTPPNS